jgi:hypothetical protein
MVKVGRHRFVALKFLSDETSKDASSTLELCHQQQRTAYKNGQRANLFRVTRRSGLDLEKESRPPVEAEFFLDIPFHRTH